MRRARLTTDHGDDTTARHCARALEPDNTDEMSSRTEGTEVVTTIERTDTAGVRSTLDDYLRNLQLAARLVDDSTPGDGRSDDSTPGDGRSYDSTPGDGRSDDSTPGDGRPDDSTPGDGRSDDSTPSDADRRRSTRTDGDADESTRNDTSSTRQTDTEHDTNE
jgi:tRNA threonylcarbamoyladenosine modification (KEOPS) complex  Pcc1 subunit